MLPPAKCKSVIAKCYRQQSVKVLQQNVKGLQQNVKVLQQNVTASKVSSLAVGGWGKGILTVIGLNNIINIININISAWMMDGWNFAGPFL